jgi:hypothetical protein
VTKEKQLGYEVRLKICPQSLVNAIDEWHNNNGIPVTMPKSIKIIHKEGQKISKFYGGST